MIAAAFLLGLACGLAPRWALSGARIRNRKAKADEIRFALALTIPHSVEDATRRMGC